MITLRTITKLNWEECIHLKTKQEQQSFITSNLYSIAEAQFIPGFSTKSIYFEEILVGFSMYGIDPDDGNYWIYRLMIDERYQGLGYGKRAMQLIINDISNKEDRTDVIWLGYKPNNEDAKKFYKKVGFQEVGLAPWGELIAKYSFA
ncbi:GNAT family N-acetyltransferase [Paenibacillus endoradicis]|uniref:GNAT family N-acetyltransferase n=1 Tax=Paenibacillus endoradicis TaxID=2972487 RepID=UPI002158ADAB|nr:GNAT family N-acetyltransferase [Paenibacillus endoradicis]MCR8656660.1 GNAT family N-acetyltransferase [Paenibacillus endoradicis]